MKLLKKMAFDFVLPATPGIASSLPLTVLDRFESLITKTLQRVRRLMHYTIEVLLPSRKLCKVESVQSVKMLSLKKPMPLIKASTFVGETMTTTHFSGRSVLCVGGQKKLYPAYRQIVEDAGGIFISFHGRTETSLNNLRTLLNDTDLVICPIDCICHEAFFVTQEFCKQHGKPCVILDKSRITTFYNGIRMLKNLQ